jgi:uncharacterized protein YidB (DUF937 family)
MLLVDRESRVTSNVKKGAAEQMLRTQRIGMLLAGGVGAALIGLGGSAVTVLAADGTTAATSAKHAAGKPDPQTQADRKAGHKAIHAAVFQAEAEVLGMKPEELRDALKHGKSVGDLAEAKGISKETFADRLATQVKPYLDRLYEEKKISKSQEERTLKSIRAGHIPGWERHHHKKH